ncbi:TetR/AcrR family transcriptional regulator [bacterium]|nr:TetR/AcrR family transcriptional regulator [bacterium]MCK5598846.1 TetR/AcrR family transcriptional regulator [bacterium]
MTTKEKIIKIALELFSQHGFENVSMDMIKDAAKIAKGTLYYHFASKDALFNATCDEMVRCITQSVIDNASGTLGSKEHFVSGFLAALDYLWDNKDKLRMFFIVKSPSNLRDFHKTHKNLLRSVVSSLHEGIVLIGIDRERAGYYASLIFSLLMSIFPGTMSGLYKDKEIYKSIVKEILNNMIGDINEK